MKCDEARPMCNRCEKADRLCEGYKETLIKLFNHPLGGVEPPSVVSRPCIATTSASINEGDMMRPFEFYLKATAPRLASYFSFMIESYIDDKLTRLLLSDKAQYLWKNLIPRSARQNPAIRYGLVALSSLHEWSEAKRHAPWQNRTFAKYYSKAIAAVKEMHQNAEPELILCACLVFAHRELLIGESNSAEATAHILSGTRIVSSLRASGARVTDVITDSIEPILDCFTAISTAYGFANDFSSPVSCESMMRHFPVLQNTFSSLTEAADQLQTALYQALVLQNLGQPYDEIMVTATRQFVNDWSIKFDYWRFRPINEESGSRRWHLLLLAQHRMVQLLLKAMPPEYDLNYCRAATDFRIMFAQIRTFLDTGSYVDAGDEKTTAIPVHSGFIVPLFFVAVNCRLGEIRQMALNTLRDLRVVEGQWNSCMAHAIACKVVEIETGLNDSQNFLVPTFDSMEIRPDSLLGASDGRLKLTYLAKMSRGTHSVHSH